jgi:hypothetical protein
MNGPIEMRNSKRAVLSLIGVAISVGVAVTPAMARCGGGYGGGGWNRGW